MPTIAEQNATRASDLRKLNASTRGESWPGAWSYGARQQPIQCSRYLYAGQASCRAKWIGDFPDIATVRANAVYRTQTGGFAMDITKATPLQWSFWGRSKSWYALTFGNEILDLDLDSSVKISLGLSDHGDSKARICKGGGDHKRRVFAYAGMRMRAYVCSYREIEQHIYTRDQWQVPVLWFQQKHVLFHKRNKWLKASLRIMREENS